MRAKLDFLVGFSGSEKLMFGTDWPLIKMDVYNRFLLQSGLDKRGLENIAYKTAESFWK